ncbi:helix-turn-helix domain-containing protein [bacterium]|nr:helix-turn-helix domain-containing protein [bacterium]
MANSESLLEAGKRLASDLLAIRRSQSIDVKEVLDATRLAEDVIEQLEETALMGNPMFNRVYLRSMFSSYASVLGIQNSEMMAALEEALSGQYIGSLAKIYLGKNQEEEAENLVSDEVESDPNLAEPSEASDSELAEGLSDNPVPAAPAEGQSLSPKKAPPNDPKSATTNPTESPDIESPSSVPDQDEKGSPIENELSSAETEEPEKEDVKGGKDANSEKSAPKKVVASSEALFIEPPSIGKPPTRTVLLPNMSGFLILVVAGIALISLIWFAVSWLMTPQTDLDELIVTTDSSQVGNRVLPERILLGDTIRVDLIAYFEALDPIRVKADRDLRRPYWIEHTERRVFEMLETIEFEREVDRARILVDGYLIPVSWYASSVRAEITREKTQAWLDSLTSAGTFPPRSIVSE